jgi:hypothetical protein
MGTPGDRQRNPHRRLDRVRAFPFLALSQKLGIDIALVEGPGMVRLSYCIMNEVVEEELLPFYCLELPRTLSTAG